MTHLEELLRTRGFAVPEAVACPRCGRTGAASTFAVVDGDPAFDGVPFICAAEYLEHVRDNAPMLAAEGWDSEAGAAARAERNRRLDSSIWAVLPGSPLTPACQAAFAAYRAALNAITVRFPAPAAVVWPDPPETDYAEL